MNTLSTNVTIFLVFFGLGAVQAIQTHDWPMVFFWMLVGLVFLSADIRKKS